MIAHVHCEYACIIICVPFFQRLTEEGDRELESYLGLILHTHMYKHTDRDEEFDSF